jgi:hypothetical protein
MITKNVVMHLVPRRRAAIAPERPEDAQQCQQSDLSSMWAPLHRTLNDTENVVVPLAGTRIIHRP